MPGQHLSVYSVWRSPLRGRDKRRVMQIASRPDCMTSIFYSDAGNNDNHNRELKNLFKSAAVSASTRPGPLRDFYLARVEKGMRPTMARLTLARKMAAISLTIWKKGVDFDAKQFDQPAA